MTQFGAVGDAKINKTASVSGTALSVSTISSTGFAPNDKGKAVSINGSGVAAGGAAPTVTVNATGGSIICNGTIWVKITYISEVGTRLTSEGRSSSEKATSCSGSSNSLSISAPSGTSGATGWVPYVSTVASGYELVQPSTGCTTPSSSGYGCNSTSNWSSTSLVFDTAQPPADTVFLTTISAYTDAKDVTLADSVIQNQTGGTVNIAWGTDNYTAVTNALNSCTEATDLTISGAGCTVFFPGPTLTTSGEYFITKGLLVTTQPTSGFGILNLTLVGGGSYGSGDTANYPPPGSASGAGAGASAEIVGSGRFPLLTVGALGQSSDANGVNIVNLGFRDMGLLSTASTDTSTLGNTWGGLRLIDIIHPYIERVNASNFGIGYGMEVEGDPTNTGGQTQVGQIVNSNCSLCRIGVWGPQNTSDIQVQGGTYSGSSASPSFGADFETNPGNTEITGSIRILGSAFRNSATAAVRFFDCSGCQVIGIKGEQVKPTGGAFGTAILLDGTSSGNCISDVVIGGGFANYGTPNINVTANCQNPLILVSPFFSVTDTATGALELSANGLTLLGVTGAAPTNAGQFSYNSTNNQFVGGLSGSTGVFPTFASPNPTTGDCVKWAANGQIADFGGGCFPLPGTRSWGSVATNGTTNNSLGESLTTTGGTGSGVVASATNPIVWDYATAATNTAIAGARGITNYLVGKNILFQAMAGDPDEGSGTQRVWIVLTDQTVPTMAASDSPTGNYIGFRYSTSASDTTWKFVTDNNNATNNVVDSMVTVDTNIHRFQVLMNDSGPSATFAIDGSPVCGTVSTKYPTSGTLLSMELTVQTLANSVRDVQFARLDAFQDPRR